MPETQAFSAPRPAWSPPTGTLGELVNASHARAATFVHEEQAWRERALARGPVPSFRAALRGENVAVIAEVKRRSPSKGDINAGLDAADRATLYQRAGAAAISVLTEPERFGGTLQDLEDVARAVSVPVLRKDFIVHPVQLYQARALGASAALLIARALSGSALLELAQIAEDIGLETLVEVRDAAELALALHAGAKVIGVNNRNLESLVMEHGTAERIVPLIPRTVVAIAESGMRTASDVGRAAAAGADAVLVGSAVSAAEDAAAAVAPLTQVPVERDARPD